MCNLSYDHLKGLCSEFPNYKQALKKHVYHAYKDRRKLFMFKALNKVDYFRNLSCEIFHDIYYRFQQQYIEEGKVLLKEMDEADSIYVIETGNL
jgi:hypothetical protein